MTSDKPNQYAIEQVLPHSAPMILLDELLDYGEDWGLCAVNIGPASLFYDSAQQGVPSYIGIEYMAQTIAAFAGADALNNQQSVEVGFLLGSRKYQPTATLFNNGSQLHVHVSRLYQEESGLRVFQCRISDSAKPSDIIVDAKVNAFLPKKNPNQPSQKEPS
ncbi:MAG: putative hotdog family 3-hydroxylacyl-ACP dehydratase [Phenylobacterium sp.]|jgi:predicted hotdog family 3-hydroxylacyl-ACP dehydratase